MLTIEPPTEWASHAISASLPNVDCVQVSLEGLTPKRKSLALGEVDILAGLQHPWIVRCFDVFQEDQNLYLVMEYLEDGTK